MATNPNAPKRGKKAARVDDPIVEEKPQILKPEDHYQLFRRDGSLLFTSTVPRLKDEFFRSKRDQHFIEHIPSIIRAAQEAEVDLTQLDLSQHNLSEVNFKGMHLAGICFYDCNFNQADLRNANLVNCDLRDCAFDQARLTGADVTGALLDDTSFAHCEARYIHGLIMLDELDDYFLYAYPRRDTPGEKGQLRIKAGCRDFSLADAREHWNEGRTDRPEIKASLAFIEAVARNRGWKIENEDPGRKGIEEIVAGDGPVADPVDDDEDEE